MDKKEIETLLATPDYDFLRKNEHLGNNIMLLTLGGSHAYGTNVPTSDVDVRGIAANRPSDLIGLSNFEQAEDKKTDTVIYSLRKITNLLMACNPNTIEILGCRPEHYAMVDERGQMLLDNKELFLSQRAVYSFGGYARAQLKRLENILARGRGTPDEKEYHIMRSVQYTLDEFCRQYGDIPEGSFTLRIGEGKTENMGTEILADINLKGYPLREFKPMMQSLGQVVSQYSTVGKRNDKKDDAHLDKHAMHLVRLYMMGLDILEKGEINTYREKDHDMLMEIRGGKFRKPDGTYSEDFFEMIEGLEKRLDYAAKNSVLPRHPDEKKIEELIMEINRKTIERVNI